MRRAVFLLILLLFESSLAKPLTPYNQGYDQGRQAGRREGDVRGREYGEADGEHDGYQAGILEARQNYLDQAQTEAYQKGADQGFQQGLAQGRSDGEKLGLQEGEREGTASGRTSADQTALKEVAPAGQAAGLARGAKAKPTEDGRREGLADGRRRARDFASQDFARGRRDYHQEQLALPVKAKLQQRQGQLSSGLLPLLSRTGEAAAFGRRAIPPCDYRFCHYPSDNEDFQKGYRRGYEAGYQAAFEERYNWSYDLEFHRSFSLGASQAHPGNLRREREAAFQQAFDEAHQEGYQQGLTESKERAYTAAFKEAFAKSYEEFYPQFRQSHFKAEEARAFQSLYGETYKLAFEKASEDAYQKALPTAREVAYKEGRAAERADFEARPVRLLECWVSPTEVENIALLTVRLRNFSDHSIAGHRISLFWGEENSRLYHAIPAGSEVLVTGAFKLNPTDVYSRDLGATLKTLDKDYPLGKVAVWAEKPVENE